MTDFRLSIDNMPKECMNTVNNYLFSKHITQFTIKKIQKSDYYQDCWFFILTDRNNNEFVLKIVVNETWGFLDTGPTYNWKCTEFDLKKEKKKNLIAEIVILISSIIQIGCVFIGFSYSYKLLGIIGLLAIPIFMFYFVILTKCKPKVPFRVIAYSMMIFALLIVLAHRWPNVWYLLISLIVSFSIPISYQIQVRKN